MLAQLGDNDVVTDLALLLLSVAALVISFLFGIVALGQAFKSPHSDKKALAAAMFPLAVGALVFFEWKYSGWNFGPWLLVPIAPALLGSAGVIVWIWRRVIRSTPTKP